MTQTELKTKLPISLLEVVFMPKDWSATNGVAWKQLQAVRPESYRCGYCGFDVASEKGLQNEQDNSFIRVCPQCNVPTFFSVSGMHIPGPKLGNNVEKLSADVGGLYNEARASLTVNAFTGVVMLCRKLLMHIAVEKGADPGKSFVAYVEWLISERYAPRGAESWVDYIRTRANEANHQIELMTQEDAKGILGLTEELLRITYELPSSVPPLPASQEETDNSGE